MAKNLYESVAEDEAQLKANPETETPTEEIDDGNELVETTRDRATTERSSATEALDGAGEGARGRRSGRQRASGRTSGRSPQGEGEASREDGETPSRDSSGTREDGETPSRSESGSGREDGRRSDVLDEDAAPVPSDHAAWAKLRREKRELEAKLKAVENKSTAPSPVTVTEQPKTDAKLATDVEPDKATNPEAWKEWKIGQLEAKQNEINQRFEAQAKIEQETKVFREAIGEFNQIRDDYISKNPDYIPAFTHGFDAYAKSIKMMNPSLSNQQITGMIDRELLKFAGQCVAKGLNPAEELYDMAIERFGYAPNSAKTSKNTEEEQEPVHEAPKGIQREAPRPNLRNIANNRKRSASPLVGAGQTGKGQLTKEGAANMTLGEMMELDPADWAELERMGGA